MAARVLVAAVAATGRTDPRCVAEWMMANRADELRRTLAGFAPRMLGGSEVVACTSGRQDCNAEPATAGDLFSWLVASDRRSAMMIWTAAPPFRRPTPRPDVPVPAGKPKKGGRKACPLPPLAAKPRSRCQCVLTPATAMTRVLPGGRHMRGAAALDFSSDR